MLYMGGKGRLGKHIAAEILKHTDRRENYYEVCLGGGNAFKHVAPHFKNSFAGDTHTDLMLMWQEAANGWIPPSAVSEDEYKVLRHAKPSALRGFVGFGCSFGGKWFGGYARSKQNGDGYYANHASRSVSEIAALFTRSGTVLRCASFDEWSPTEGDVVYADPPYRGTTKYKTPFDHNRFWRVMREWCERGVVVFVSEYAAPSQWHHIWTHEQRRKVSGGTGGMTTEKLFVLDK